MTIGKLETITNALSNKINMGLKVMALTAMAYATTSCMPVARAEIPRFPSNAPYECIVQTWPKDNGYDIDISHPNAETATWNVWYDEGSKQIDVFKDASKDKAYQSGFQPGLEMYAVGKHESGDCASRFIVGQ
jgi:hypothetical protein